MELEHLFLILRFVAQQEQSGLSSSSPSAFLSRYSDGKCENDVDNAINSESRNENKSNGNSLIIPESVARPLEQFRMAITNIPVKEEAVQQTRTALHLALRNTYPNKADELDELCNYNAVAVGVQPSKKPSFMLNAMYTVQEMHEVFPGLYVGSYHPAANKDFLLNHNVTHILCCIGTKPRFPDTFTYMTISAQDSPTFNIAKYFLKTFNFIDEALSNTSSGVLVHCGAGISRAPTIVAAYLINKLRLTASAAIALIQQVRFVASPNAGFRRQLLMYQKNLGIGEKALSGEEIGS